MSVTPTELLRRLYRSIERGKGMMLSAEDLDVLAQTGALAALSASAADYVKKQADARQSALKDQRQASLDDEWRQLHPRPSPNPEAEQAARRAWEMCQPKSKRP